MHHFEERYDNSGYLVQDQPGCLIVGRFPAALGLNSALEQQLFGLLPVPPWYTLSHSGSEATLKTIIHLIRSLKHLDLLILFSEF